MMIDTLQRRHLERNLTLLKWLGIDETFFCSAVAIAFEMHTVGLTLTQVLIGESVFALMFLLMDVPTSVFSDLVHRKSALIFGEICLLMGVILLGISQNFTQVLLCQVIWGIGAAAVSGTDRAILYDSLKALGREADHRRILGKNTSFAMILIATGQVLSGFIGYYFGLRLAVLLCISIPILKLIIMSFLAEPVKEAPVQSRTPFRHAAATCSWIIHAKVIPFLMLADVFFCLGWKLVLQTFNPYMELVQMPVFTWGIFLAAFNLIGAFIAHRSHTIQARLGSALSFMMIFAMQIVGFLLMAAFHLPFIGAMIPFFFFAATSFEEIFYSDEINRRTPSDRRATVLSMGTFMMQLVQMLSLPILGYVGNLYGLPSMYLIMGTIVLVVGTVGGLGLRKALEK